MPCESDVVREFFRELRGKLQHKDILSDLNDPRKTMRLYREAETIEEGIANHYELNFERRAIFFIIIMCSIYAESSINAPPVLEQIMVLHMSLGVVFFIATEILETFVDDIFVEQMRDMSIQSYFKHKVLDGMLGKSFFKHKPNLDGVEASYKAGQLMQEFCEAYNLSMDKKYLCTISFEVMTSPVNIPTGDVPHYYELAVLRKMIWGGKSINPITNESLGRDLKQKLLLNPYETVDKGMQEIIFKNAADLYRSRHTNNPSDNADEPLALAAGPQ